MESQNFIISIRLVRIYKANIISILPAHGLVLCSLSLLSFPLSLAFVMRLYKSFLSVITFRALMFNLRRTKKYLFKDKRRKKIIATWDHIFCSRRLRNRVEYMFWVLMNYYVIVSAMFIAAIKLKRSTKNKMFIPPLNISVSFRGICVSIIPKISSCATSIVYIVFHLQNCEFI